MIVRGAYIIVFRFFPYYKLSHSSKGRRLNSKTYTDQERKELKVRPLQEVLWNKSQVVEAFVKLYEFDLPVCLYIIKQTGSNVFCCCEISWLILNAIPKSIQLFLTILLLKAMSEVPVDSMVFNLFKTGLEFKIALLFFSEGIGEYTNIGN